MNTAPQRAEVDLWWSGKQQRHGGNLGMIQRPDGWRLSVSEVRPGREHDTAAALPSPELLVAVDACTDEGRHVLADPGCEGVRHRLVVPVKTGSNGRDHTGRPGPLTEKQECLNQLHSATRAQSEQGNAWLKMTIKTLRKVRIDPGRIGTLT